MLIIQRIKRGVAFVVVAIESRLGIMLNMVVQEFLMIPLGIALSNFCQIWVKDQMA